MALCRLGNSAALRDHASGRIEASTSALETLVMTGRGWPLAPSFNAQSILVPAGGR